MCPECSHQLFSTLDTCEKREESSLYGCIHCDYYTNLPPGKFDSVLDSAVVLDPFLYPPLI